GDTIGATETSRTVSDMPCTSPDEVEGAIGVRTMSPELASRESAPTERDTPSGVARTEVALVWRESADSVSPESVDQVSMCGYRAAVGGSNTEGSRGTTSFTRPVAFCTSRLKKSPLVEGALMTGRAPGTRAVERA